MKTRAIRGPQLPYYDRSATAGGSSAGRKGITTMKMLLARARVLRVLAGAFEREEQPCIGI